MLVIAGIFLSFEQRCVTLTCEEEASHHRYWRNWIYGLFRLERVAPCVWSHVLYTLVCLSIGQILQPKHACRREQYLTYRQHRNHKTPPSTAWKATHHQNHDLSHRKSADEDLMQPIGLRGFTISSTGMKSLPCISKLLGIVHLELCLYLFSLGLALNYVATVTHL